MAMMIGATPGRHQPLVVVACEIFAGKKVNARTNDDESCEQDDGDAAAADNCQSATYPPVAQSSLLYILHKSLALNFERKNLVF